MHPAEALCYAQDPDLNAQDPKSVVKAFLPSFLWAIMPELTVGKGTLVVDKQVPEKKHQKMNSRLPILLNWTLWQGSSDLLLLASPGITHSKKAQIL
jgi:hypothetical protein